MKYTKQYENETAYNSDTTRVKPNVSLLIAENDVKYNPYNISGRVAKAGTIVLSKTSNESKKIFVPYESWDKETYRDYTPFGVVVVPFTHTIDNTVRIMSLKNMSCNEPDNGSTSEGGVISGNSMYWGGYGFDISGLANYTAVPQTDKLVQGGTVGTKDWVRIPSNYTDSSTFSGGVESTLDIGTKYYSSTEDDRFGISPYSIYDWKSYEAFGVINKATNAMLDCDGKSNTDKILAVDNSSSTEWQTAATITNVYDSQFIHAPAQCCWRYSTVGTQQGEWYLPACGELLYLISRYKDINGALTKLMEEDTVHPNNAIRLWRYDSTIKDSSTSLYGYWLWSSTESSSYSARNVGVNSGYVDYNYKDNSRTHNRVRAFAALPV